MIFTYLLNHIVIFSPSTPEGKYKFNCPARLDNTRCDLKDLNHI